MREMLKLIVKNTHTEARWLQTLSLLEHIGARKISRTVCQYHPSLNILAHLADETRHAFLFKKVALELDPKIGEKYLCADEAQSYFQILDTTISEWLHSFTHRDDSYSNYLFVTLFIEKRAMSLYPLYLKMTQHREVKEVFHAVINEESGHLHDIEKEVRRVMKKDKIPDFEFCRKFEESLFGVLSASITRAVEGKGKALLCQPQEAGLTH